MDNIIRFLEQYWGQSLIGTVTLGTVITFVITQIKMGFRDKVKNNNIDKVITKADDLCSELNTREEQHKKERKQLEDQIAQMSKKEEYFESVQAATFQAISYLVIASKLPTEDKIALQDKFSTLINNKYKEYKEIISDEVTALKNEVTQKIIPDAQSTIDTTVQETKSLLDKYMKEG